MASKGLVRLPLPSPLLNSSAGISSCGRPKCGSGRRYFSLPSPRCANPAGPISVNGLVDYFRLLGWIHSQRLSDHPSPITSIASLSEQADASDGLQLNALLRYEADPPSSRRVRTGAWNPVGRPTDGLLAGPEIKRDDRITAASKTNDQEQGVREHGAGILSLSYIITIDQDLTRSENQLADIKLPPQEHVITCSGFLIECQDSKERILATCAHTLWQSNTILANELRHASLISTSHGERTVRSGCLARDQLGNAFMVSQVISALASADVLFFRLIKLPATPPHLQPPNQLALEEAKTDAFLVDSLVDFSSMSLEHHGALDTLASFLTLPVSPYPPPLSSPVCIPQLLNSDAGDSLFHWELGRVIEYKDTMGIKATPGTYDPLNTMIVSAVPRHGSSGGPIVNENGTVVGMIRGFQSAYDQKHAVGFGTVSERFWELFQLPGLRSASFKND
ncbi:hypothetical protein PTTG_05889 [Puccinia triticina 1-1 BBBD Race 1]|uniref:Serine protease n=2 Tax=Puccinia triticina TaxID=208348 RepID=A0A180GY89_PUCT1|nr:uncharacterized protein PtA15_17A155 [Puccinia triticina]OAV97298.1 hypothetical protein PTTG_05889 [Puccinia triticina 1-1 BBBD Race 1]WAQ92673.1 hypothetical protein PtA15_17A155 [Puccinia triticina]WAR63565.1 hypothetical protein PtB15_17B165 [Puccinia triticina]